MDGRDIGTVVFPHAEIKIFVTASIEVRTQRRLLELQTKGIETSKEEVQDNLIERDFIDSNRKESPLRQAVDAIVLDNSTLSRQQQLEWALDLVRTR
jgi:cytidylate kinase